MTDSINSTRPKKRVLIIDDIRTDLHLLGKLVSGFGHETILAESAVQANDLINESIDLVIVDAIMPVMDGFTFVKNMRQNDKLTIPAIMITSLSGREDRIRAVEAGVNDFVSKPVDKVELRVRINSMLKMKAAQDKVRHYQRDLEKQVEQKTSDLSLALSKIDAVVNNVNDCMLLINNTHHIIEANKAFFQLAKLNGLKDQSGLDFFSLLTTEEQVESFKQLLESTNKESQQTIGFPQWGNKVFSVISTGIENNSHVLVMRDITERVKADEQRAQLLSLLSHELRTPLNGIKGLTSIIVEERDLLTEEHADYFESIIECGDQLESVVTELLKFVKLADYKEEFEDKTIELKPIIEKIIRESYRGNISIRVEGSSPHLFCKEMHIEEVFKQIISNAIRFNSDNPQIDIKLVNKPDTIQFICTDNGTGIPQEYLDRVFDSFFQVENYLSRTKAGLGLGLTIAKRIVELYNGNISLSSVENEGTEVIVEFPVS